MSFDIYTTGFFEKELKRLAKKYPSLKTDFKSLVKSLKENPQHGQPLGKDCYKIRMSISSKGKGKSGGSRIIYCLKIVAKSFFYCPFTTNPKKKIYQIMNWIIFSK
jgi:mRNA-degrading endonuclease RelE of RelBE toxin-antitoxin system